jgi:hypothetical protein
VSPISTRHSTTGYAIFDPTLTLTAQHMIGTEWLHAEINDTPAGWSSTFDTVHGNYCRCIYIFQPYHDTTGLYINFGWAVDWMPRALKPIALSTTEHTNRNAIDATDYMSRRIVICEESRAWHGLASVFCLLSVFYLCFNGCVFVGRDNTLEECLTESL